MGKNAFEALSSTAHCTFEEKIGGGGNTRTCSFLDSSLAIGNFERSKRTAIEYIINELIIKEGPIEKGRFRTGYDRKRYKDLRFEERINADRRRDLETNKLNEERPVSLAGAASRWNMGW
jgi:hypothetical protein